MLDHIIQNKPQVKMKTVMDLSLTLYQTRLYCSTWPPLKLLVIRKEKDQSWTVSVILYKTRSEVSERIPEGKWLLLSNNLNMNICLNGAGSYSPDCKCVCLYMGYFTDFGFFPSISIYYNPLICDFGELSFRFIKNCPNSF